jgi:hypothetical protein
MSSETTSFETMSDPAEPELFVGGFPREGFPA